MVELEAEHVHKVYSEIAAHFSDTRFKPWPRIAHFLQEQASGSLIADVGIIRLRDIDDPVPYNNSLRLAVVMAST